MAESDFKLSAEAIAAINAVEGLCLSEESKARLNKLEAKGLSPDAQIEAIRKAYKEKVA